MVTRIPTGGDGSQFIAIARDGRRAYVSNTGGSNSSVSVIDLSTNRLVGSPIPMDGAALNLVLTPDERFVYVATRALGIPCGPVVGCGALAVIETSTNTVIATVPVGRSPSNLAIAPTFTVVPAPACADGVDNDGDEEADFSSRDFRGDRGCDSPFDASEKSPAVVCDDGLDNDGDGLTDYPTDPGCASASANLEDPTCNNGIDDDGDGLADFPADSSCASSAGESEKSPYLACDDGVDNDLDGFTDYPADLDCLSLTSGIEETDVDSDGIAPRDNCARVPNPSQLDSDLDGYGNACDADYDDDGIVTNRDFILLRFALGSTIAISEYQGPLEYDGDGLIGIADFRLLRFDFGDMPYVRSLDADGDGTFGFPELDLVRSAFGSPPGPSGLACAGTTGSCYCEYNYCGGF